MSERKFLKPGVNLEISRRLIQELRDKLLDNMNLDDVNIDNVAAYINTCPTNHLLDLCKIAEALDDWQLIGRIIGNAVETYKNVE